MKSKRYDLWNQEEYNYPIAFGFTPNIMSYLHHDKQIRPCMLVVPGGAYAVVSSTEGEIVAKEFYEKGYNAFVLTYTTNVLSTVPLINQPLKDISRAIRLIRKDAGTFCIDPDKLVICGFSAGGHLCGSICVHFLDIIDDNQAYSEFSNRPNAAILSYPVITSGEFAHQGSIINLLGHEPTEAELEYVSLEKQVSKDTPPVFLWQTAEDEAVPVENSYLYADACRKNGVTFTHHVFSWGRHGLSLANEVWANGEYGTPYTMEQTINVIAKVRAGEIPLSKEEKEALLFRIDKDNKAPDPADANQPNEAVRIWPLLAEQWLKGILNKK